MLTPIKQAGGLKDKDPKDKRHARCGKCYNCKAARGAVPPAKAPHDASEAGLTVVVELVEQDLALIIAYRDVRRARREGAALHVAER